MTTRPSESSTAGFTRRGRCVWAPWLGKGNDPRYTPTTTFETFPFPEGLSPDVPAAERANHPGAAAIAEAAERLVALRDRWLNPPEWVEWVTEGVAGYPERAVPRDEASAKALGRTHAHPSLQHPAAMARRCPCGASMRPSRAAYGWSPDLSEAEVLRELLAINLVRGV